jgi:CHAT domain-containing protein
VPDGALQRVPFAALPAAADGFEAEHGPALHLLSAERDIVASVNREPSGQGLLAMGAPDFDRAGTTRTDAGDRTRGAKSACESFRSLHFDPLPGARIEIGQVARRWRTACADSQAGVLLGAAADERALRERAPGRRVLHLATHGFYLGAACARRDRIDSLALEDPLLRSGLSLAGANLRAGPAGGEDDGILTAAEVAALNLEGVEWAVLSACETARGDVQDGEGVLGLRRGFAIAGARTLVSSLWAVDDASTGRWMDALYAARFGRHLDTAEAVREAQRAVLKARRAEGESDHPYYWAGFVAAGDWQ